MNISCIIIFMLISLINLNFSFSVTSVIMWLVLGFLDSGGGRRGVMVF